MNTVSALNALNAAMQTQQTELGEAAARPSLVVIGNGMAGIRTVEELLKLAPDKYRITVFGAEPHGNYNRILLSPLLAGEKTLSDIMLNSREWYAQQQITLHTDDPVLSIDRRRRVVRSRAGLEVAYDRLLLATGSKPFIVPVPGHQLPGVMAFRELQDVAAMQAAARTQRHAVVIGGGLLGLEAANGLLRQGMEVTVVHNSAHLMDRQLDPAASSLLQSALEARGLRFMLASQTQALLGETRVRAVRFADGREIPADLVVMAAGVRPQIELAQQAGLHCERAIVVDDTLQTYDPRIYAVGECVQHRQTTFGLVAPLWEQARVCAAHLAGTGHRRYIQQATATKLKVSGVSLYSAGVFSGAADTEDLLLRDARRGIYKRLVVQGNRLIGAVLYGEVSDGPWYFDLIQQARDISPLRDGLLFGQAFCAARAA